MEINEKIHIEEYNPEWIGEYECEKEQLSILSNSNYFQRGLLMKREFMKYYDWLQILEIVPGLLKL